MATTKTETDKQTELSEAIVNAKNAMGNALKSSTNPHFKSRYADYGAVREATLAALAKNNLTVEHQTIYRDGRLLLLTWFRHANGLDTYDRASEWPLFDDATKPQPMGSGLTYGKRYGHSLICGIASDEDDDGTAAQEAGAAVGVKQKTIAEARAAKDYEGLIDEMQQCETRNDLFKWRHEVAPRRAALPNSWQQMLDEQCEMHRFNLVRVDEGVK